MQAAASPPGSAARSPVGPRKACELSAAPALAQEQVQAEHICHPGLGVDVRFPGGGQRSTPSAAVCCLDVGRRESWCAAAEGAVTRGWRSVNWRGAAGASDSEK